MRFFVLFCLLLFLPLLSVNPARADSHFPDMTEAKTVEAALLAAEDTAVELTGHIIKRVSKTGYIFQDNTGTIKVDIDRDLFQNRTITPEKKIHLTGKLEIDKKQYVVEVSQFNVVD